MELPLDPTECRILGVLIEKQLATPDAYPLTVNALVSGCNQKSSRRPVMLLQDFEVEGALRSLYVKKWVTNTNASGRALRWMHRIDESLGLGKGEKAVLAELLLRGAAQPGELRTNAARMAPSEVATQEALHAILDRLASLVPALATKLPRRPGERAERHAHLLGGTPSDPTPEEPGEAEPTTVPANAPDLAARVRALEQQLQRLEDAVRALGGRIDEDLTP